MYNLLLSYVKLLQLAFIMSEKVKNIYFYSCSSGPSTC